MRRNRPAPAACPRTLAFTAAPLATIAPATAQATFAIETEDFNHGGGQHVTSVDTMPYYGSACSGVTTLSYTAESGDIDYFLFRAITAPQITEQPADVNVVEGGSATFSVQSANTTAATYQWLRNTVNIDGATTASYCLPNVSAADHGAQFRCFISNPIGSTNTRNAPVQVKTLLVNGVPYPVTWTGLTSWSLRLALAPGANALTLTALDSYGRTVAGL